MQRLVCLLFIGSSFFQISCLQTSRLTIQSQDLNRAHLNEMVVLNSEFVLSDKNFFGKEKVSDSTREKASQAFLDTLLIQAKKDGLALKAPSDSLYKGASFVNFERQTNRIHKAYSAVSRRSRGSLRIQPDFDFSKNEMNINSGYGLLISVENVEFNTEPGYNLGRDVFLKTDAFVVDISSDSILWVYHNISPADIYTITEEQKRNVISSIIYALKYGKDSTPESFENLKEKKNIRIILEDESILTGYILNYKGLILTVVDSRGENSQKIHLKDVRVISHRYGGTSVIFPLLE